MPIVKHHRPYVTCQFCETGNLETAYFCNHCGFPQKWNEGIAVNAPATLINIAHDYHGGQFSGLYSVLSTGLIFKERARELESELRHIGTCGTDDQETIVSHLLAVEHLTDQLPEEE